MSSEMNRVSVKPIDAFSLVNNLTNHLTDKDREDYDYYSMLGDISIAIVNFRTEHKLTQEQLAGMLGVSQAMVSKYESGDYNFSLQTINHICHALGLKMSLSLKKDYWRFGCEIKAGGSDVDSLISGEASAPPYATSNICGSADIDTIHEAV